MPKCDSNKVGLQLHFFSPARLLHIFRTPVAKNTRKKGNIVFCKEEFIYPGEQYMRVKKR